MSIEVVILEMRYTVLPRLAELIFSLQSRQDWHVTIPGPRVVVVVPEDVEEELVEEVEEAADEVVDPAVVVVVDVTRNCGVIPSAGFGACVGIPCIPAGLESEYVLYAVPAHGVCVHQGVG
jgi:hypothetical protein